MSPCPKRLINDSNAIFSKSQEPKDINNDIRTVGDDGDDDAADGGETVMVGIL